MVHRRTLGFLPEDGICIFNWTPYRGVDFTQVRLGFHRRLGLGWTAGSVVSIRVGPVPWACILGSFMYCGLGLLDIGWLFCIYLGWFCGLGYGQGTRIIF